jgi:hydroxyethylthiazole kinase-like uncharacterized protein yjeF
MEPLVTSAEMRDCDRSAITGLMIPGLVLMENAGRGVVDLIEKQYGMVMGKSFIVVCGKGNNGGDGFVVARHLLLRGAKVSVVILSHPGDYKNDAKVNYKILKNLIKDNRSHLCMLPYPSLRRLSMLPKGDFLIDAIFGTGFSGELRGHYHAIINWMNDRIEVKIAIDSPSGLDTDTGAVHGVAFKADMTVTMCLKKIGLYIGKAREYVGKVEVVDIGFPPERSGKNYTTQLIHLSDIKKSLPLRPFNVHKHNVGKILVLAGSRGLTGAAAMTSMSAMRVGAGAVVLGTPESVYPVLAKKLTEVMVTPLWETSGGSLSNTAFDQMKIHLDWADLVIIGPGLSVHPETVELIQHIIKTVQKPMVIDADGLNAFTNDPVRLRRHKSKNIIITPHTGELSRIIGIPSAEIEANRVTIAKQCAKELDVILVLKGAPTVSVTQKEIAYLNSTGNAGMATAGSGDILTGVISGLWAQKMPPEEAAYTGVYIHGLSGDLAKGKLGEKSLLAMDINQFLPQAFQFVELNG